MQSAECRVQSFGNFSARRKVIYRHYSFFIIHSSLFIFPTEAIMKRIFAVILCVLMLCPLLLSAMPAVAVEETKIGYSSPAIFTDVGKTVDLRWISVQFEDQKDCVSFGIGRVGNNSRGRDAGVGGFGDHRHGRGINFLRGGT